MTTINQPAFFNTWDHRCTFELALGLEDVANVLARYNLTVADFEKLKKHPAFMQQIIDYRAEIKEKGLTFRAKARIMAEDLLTQIYDIAVSPATPAAVRVEAVKFVTKAADLEPKDNSKQQEMAFLPAIAAAIQSMSDGDLELRVTQLVSRKNTSIKDITHEALPD